MKGLKNKKKKKKAACLWGDKSDVVGSYLEMLWINFVINMSCTQVLYRYWNRWPREAPSIIGSAEGQTGWSFEQSGPVKDISLHGRGVELGDLCKSLPI